MLLSFPTLILVAVTIFLIVVILIILAVAGIFKAKVLEPDEKYLTKET